MKSSEYVFTVPAGMLFKRMYCGSCGNKLKKTFTSKIYKKGDLGYERPAFTRFEIPFNYQTTSSTYVYYCPRCRWIIDYEQQLIIQKLQKKYGRYKLTKEEIRKYYDER